MDPILIFVIVANLAVSVVIDAVRYSATIALLGQPVVLATQVLHLNDSFNIQPFWKKSGSDDRLSETSNNKYIAFNRTEDGDNDSRRFFLVIANISADEFTTFEFYISPESSKPFELFTIVSSTGPENPNLGDLSIEQSQRRCGTVLAIGWAVAAVLFLTLLFICLGVAIHRKKGKRVREDYHSYRDPVPAYG